MQSWGSKRFPPRSSKYSTGRAHGHGAPLPLGHAFGRSLGHPGAPRLSHAGFLRHFVFQGFPFGHLFLRAQRWTFLRRFLHFGADPPFYFSSTGPQDTPCLVHGAYLLLVFPASQGRFSVWLLGLAVVLFCGLLVGSWPQLLKHVDYEFNGWNLFCVAFKVLQMDITDLGSLWFEEKAIGHEFQQNLIPGDMNRLYVAVHRVPR